MQNHVSRETSSVPAFAAGCLILARSTGRVLLLDRSDGSGWCQPGGWAEEGEAPEDTAARELFEECGIELGAPDWDSSFEVIVPEKGGPFVLGAVMNFRTQALSPRLIYVMFVAETDAEFPPLLNEEHRAYTWADPDDTGRHLHPGCRVSLEYLRRSYR